MIDQVSPMTSEDALDFVQKMQKAFPKTPRSKKELAALQKYLAKFTDAELRAVGNRVLSDLMQRPPRTIEAGDYPPAPSAGPETRGTPRATGPSGGGKSKKGAKPKGTAGRRAARPRSARRRTKRS